MNFSVRRNIFSYSYTCNSAYARKLCTHIDKEKEIVDVHRASAHIEERRECVCIIQQLSLRNTQMYMAGCFAHIHSFIS
jgi:hypothetical protein